MQSEPVHHFPCPRCGDAVPCHVGLSYERAGKMVTLWCSACEKLFDVQMPSRPPRTSIPRVEVTRDFQCPCSMRLLYERAGKTVTLWCSTCEKLFDVQMPPID